MSAINISASTRRAKLHRHFRQLAAREYQAATPVETRIIDAMNDGDLRPLSRHLWRHKGLTPRLALFVSLLIRDPGGVSTTKLQVAPKRARRGRPAKRDAVTDELLGREIAGFQAANERQGRGGLKVGVSRAEEEFGMSRSSIKRHAKAHREAARRRIKRDGANK